MNCRINRNTGQVGFDTAEVGSITDTFGKLKDAYARYAPRLKSVYAAATDKGARAKDEQAEEMPPEELPPSMMPPQKQEGFPTAAWVLLGVGLFLLLRGK